MNATPTHDISKIDSAVSAVSLVSLMRNADKKRSNVRASVKGIIDGNPPYKSSDLSADGQSYRTNVNFREAEQYLGLALSAFYDLHSESPTLATITCEVDDDENAAEYSRIITSEFDKLQKKDKSFDSEVQLHHHEMVLYGTGPIFWDSPTDWRCKSLRSASLMVPEGTKTDVESWTSCVVLSPYSPDELYKCIDDEESASRVGWDLKTVKQSIMMASPQTTETSRTWEWHQQQLRNNTVLYSARASKVLAAHVFVKEDSGKISHYIVDERHPSEFLYKKRDKYESWSEFIHPMYYDKGDGEHHSVKGMGVKMYSIMELKNRAKCNLVDAAAFRGQTLIQPKNSEAMIDASIVPKGPYSVMPPNFDIIPQQATGVLDAPLAVDKELDNVLAGNLSQYRQRIEKPDGNPRTAFEIQAILAQQSTIGKTQISRYYAQMDAVYSEKFRRAVNCSSSSSVYSKLAMEFKSACAKQGVPTAALSKCCVKATRVVGQGSSAMRSQALESLLNISGAFPPAGQQNLLMDIIASKVGQSMLGRYYPSNKTNSTEQDQAALATLERAAIKGGIIPLVTGSQDHLIHAQTHIHDGATSVQAAEQNPESVPDIASYLIGLVQHTGEHMAALQRDVIHQREFAALKPQFQRLVKIASDMASHAQGQAQAQAQQQPAQGGGNQEEMMKQMAFVNDQKRKDMTVQNDIKRKQLKAQQDMALKDTKTAAAIRRTAVKEKEQGQS